jgi:hypothetical protein
MDNHAFEWQLWYQPKARLASGNQEQLRAALCCQYTELATVIGQAEMEGRARLMPHGRRQYGGIYEMDFDYARHQLRRNRYGW